MRGSKTTTTRKSGQTRATGRSIKKRVGPPGKNGSGETGAAAGSIELFGLSFLENVHPVSELQLKLASGSGYLEEQLLLKTIDTEKKQLLAIEQLYAIVKAQPAYANLKEPAWPAEKKPVLVLQWLLSKLSPLAKGNEWTIDTYGEGANQGFRFVVYKYYNSQKLTNREEHFNCNFLPNLFVKDRPLHDIIISVIAIVARENKVPLWDEDGDYSTAIEQLQKNKTQPDSFTNYFTGNDYLLSVTYLSLIRYYMKTVTPAKINKLMKAYEFKSQRLYSIRWWLNSGLKLAQTKECILEHSYVPHYNKGTPITPFRLYKFIWCNAKDDLIDRVATKKFKKDDDADGWYIPRMFTITNPGEVVKKIENYEFPPLLYDFLSTGIKIFNWRYKDYFFKEKKVTPKRTLLEIFNDEYNLEDEQRLNQ